MNNNFSIRKKTFAFAILVIMVVAFFGGCACSKESKFIGTWKNHVIDRTLIINIDGTGTDIDHGKTYEITWTPFENSNKVISLWEKKDGSSLGRLEYDSERDVLYKPEDEKNKDKYYFDRVEK